MSNEYFVNSTDLASIANAIREKGKITEQLVFPTGFVTAIQELKNGPEQVYLYEIGNQHTDITGGWNAKTRWFSTTSSTSYTSGTYTIDSNGLYIKCDGRQDICLCAANAIDLTGYTAIEFGVKSVTTNYGRDMASLEIYNKYGDNMIYNTIQRQVFIAGGVYRMPINLSGQYYIGLTNRSWDAVNYYTISYIKLVKEEVN